MYVGRITCKTLECGLLLPNTDVAWSVYVSVHASVEHNHDLLFSLAILDPRVGHTMDVLSPFIHVLCHSDRLFHVESCPRLDVVHPGRAWSSSPRCTWHCSLHYLFLPGNSLVSSWTTMSPTKTAESIEAPFGV